jgi:hypothetical protein
MRLHTTSTAESVDSIDQGIEYVSLLFKEKSWSEELQVYKNDFFK